MPYSNEDCITTLVIAVAIAVFKAWDFHTAGVALGFI